MKKLNVVNHTHWDREWYESFETYRGKLVEGIKLILHELDSGQFEYFMLDGQTIVIEDLKEVLEPVLMEKLEGYIRSRKIDIGPWYVLPDEFLVSGESIIRNLKLGIEISNNYNADEFIGYLPDTFGHIGQLPQIFKGLGLGWSLLFRGVNKDKKSEAIFIGSDGTKIKSFILPLWTGYYNHFLSYKNYKEAFEKYIKDIEEYCHSDEPLLLNGADHLIPYHKIKERLQELEIELDIQIKQTTLKDYAKLFDEVELKDCIEGEQRDESKAYILTNVLSSRTYLKVHNQEVEDEITAVAEPMELIKSLMTAEYKHNYLKQAWKLLLQNHPHDSICGCSIDKVHKEMETRTDKLKDILASVEYHAAKALISSDPVNNRKLYVFNPHPYEFSKIISTKVIIPQAEGFIGLVDSEGSKVPVHIINKERKQIFKADVDLEPNWYEVDEYEIMFEAKSKGIGFKEYSIVEGESSVQKTLSEAVLENNHIKIYINENGYLNILNKASCKLYKDINKFISTMDNGDEYTYSPPFEDVMSQAGFIGVEKIASTELSEQMTLLYELQQPEGLRSDRKGPSKDRVKSFIRTIIKLDKHSKTIVFETEVDNKARDQRLRVIFPLASKVEHYYTDVSFDKVKREPLKEIYFDAKRLSEVKVNTYPTDSFVEVPGEFSVIHRGLQECEVTNYNHEADAVYLSVIRSVGWLSRDDIRTRGGGAGPKFKTPDAQCIGRYSFNYAITFEENPAFEAKLMRTEPRAFQGNSIKEGLENLIELDNKEVLVSAFYRSSKGDVIIRLYNLSQQSQKVNIKGSFKEVHTADLRDNILEASTSTLTIGSRKIVSLCLK